MWKTAFKKNEGIWSAQADHVTSNLLKSAFHKLYSVHFWILCSYWLTGIIHINPFSVYSLLYFHPSNFFSIFWILGSNETLVPNGLTLACIMLKNDHTYFKYLVVFTPQDFWRMFVWPFLNIMHENVKHNKVSCNNI